MRGGDGGLMKINIIIFLKKFQFLNTAHFRVNLIIIEKTEKVGQKNWGLSFVHLAFGLLKYL